MYFKVVEYNNTIHVNNLRLNILPKILQISIQKLYMGPVNVGTLDENSQIQVLVLT